MEEDIASDRFKERAPGLPELNETGVLALVEEVREETDPNPRSFEFAGVNPSCTRGIGERVGMSRKKPAFFF